MNCKQGDLAVIVRSEAGNEGKIVRCLEFVGAGKDDRRTDCWRIDRLLPGTTWPLNEISDSKLRPLRDNDGEDEMLRIAGLPREVA